MNTILSSLNYKVYPWSFNILNEAYLFTFIEPRASDCSEVNDSNNESKLSSEHDRNSSFNRIQPDMIRYIATFMEPKEVANWRTVNGLTRFSIPLKKAVELIFNISGLDGINDFEPELAGVMRLAQISHDNMHFFTTLMRDVVCGKKPYKVLFSPLILHLLRLFRELGAREKQDYQQNFTRILYADVEKFMTKICALKGHFDLVFEIAGDNAELVGWALCDAAQMGHTHIADHILERPLNISAGHVGWALRSASYGGHTHIVEQILQYRADISVSKGFRALCNAGKNGHTVIVDLLLQRFTNIPAVRVGEAIRLAAKNGHTPDIELFLQYRNDIPALYVSCALEYAASGGHTFIVDLLLQHFTDIPVVRVGSALEYATRGGHTPIVELLLQYRNDILSEHVCYALGCAARGGHTHIVGLLLQARNDIPAVVVGSALNDASLRGHAPIVELLQSHEAPTVELHSQSRNNISAYVGIDSEDGDSDEDNDWHILDVNLKSMLMRLE
jgi:hypothetical protein